MNVVLLRVYPLGVGGVDPCYHGVHFEETRARTGAERRRPSDVLILRVVKARPGSAGCPSDNVRIKTTGKNLLTLLNGIVITGTQFK